jgi:hypothetical protein
VPEASGDKMMLKMDLSVANETGLRNINLKNLKKFAVRTIACFQHKSDTQGSGVSGDEEISGRMGFAHLAAWKRMKGRGIPV